MTNNNIDVLKVIRDYNPLEKTKEETLSEINKTFGKYFVDSNLDKIPIEHLMLLYPFSTFKPQKGTIGKVSDFLIFHSSYATFSSRLKIVNYQKVIRH
jgi:hypothetical protein